MKVTNLLMGSLLIFAMHSCSNDHEEFSDNRSVDSDIKVVKMGEITSSSLTRSESEKLANEEILQFKDYAAFERTMAKLGSSSTEQKIKFAKDLGFTSAFAYLTSTDQALDALLDLDNDEEIRKGYEKIKKSTQGYITFSTSDKYDLTPDLQFSDEGLSPIQNKEGYFAIGNKLFSKMISAVTRGPIGPMEPVFEKFNNASAVIKQGRYRSDVTLGIDRNSGLFMLRFASQKKKRFWKKRYSTDYKVDATLGTATYNLVEDNPRWEGVVIRFILPYFNSKVFRGQTVNFSFENFKSGCCPDQVGSAYFTHDFPSNYF